MLSRRLLLAGLALVSALASVPVMAQQTDALPHGTTARPRQAILDLVHATTDAGQPRLRGAGGRLATFDQDGTLWVEHPIYSQVVFALDRVAALAPEHPGVEARRSRSRRSSPATARPSPSCPCAISRRSYSPPTPGWMSKRSRRSPQTGPPRPKTIAGTDPTRSWSTSRCWNSSASCAPTATAPTSSPAAARISSAPMPRPSTASPSEVIGSTLDIKYGYDAKGQGVLMREPKLELNNNNSGKPEDIYLFTGQRPQAAFGNSTGDRQMIEWATAEAGSGWACWSCTTTPSANMPMARPRACPTPRSAPSPKPCMTRRRSAAGSWLG